MILVTGAAGKTGQAVIAALARRGQPVRALAHRAASAAALMGAGAAAVIVGDMRSLADMRDACGGISAAYHICPNLHPDEVEIARTLLRAMTEAGVRRLVYHSVLHPQVEAMPHHWQKLRVEELILTHNVEWTILQPAAYMQNVFGYWRTIVEEEIYRVPYAVRTRLGMVDLADVAEAAAAVLSEPRHAYAICELAGPEILDQGQIAAVLNAQLGRPVRVETQDRDEWQAQMLAGGADPAATETLVRMFEYYERYGFYGNPRVLEGLLGRQPATFAEAVSRFLAAGQKQV